MHSTQIAGEPVYQLLNALSQFKMTPTADGMVRGTAKLDSDVGLTFQRAIMRIEAEFLIQDADALTHDNFDDVRTESQRRADAFVELAQRIGKQKRSTKSDL